MRVRTSFAKPEWYRVRQRIFRLRQLRRLPEIFYCRKHPGLEAGFGRFRKEGCPVPEYLTDFPHFYYRTHHKVNKMEKGENEP